MASSAGDGRAIGRNVGRGFRRGGGFSSVVAKSSPSKSSFVSSSFGATSVTGTSIVAASFGMGCGRSASSEAISGGATGDCTVAMGNSYSEELF